MWWQEVWEDGMKIQKIRPLENQSLSASKDANGDCTFVWHCTRTESPKSGASSDTRGE